MRVTDPLRHVCTPSTLPIRTYKPSGPSDGGSAMVDLLVTLANSIVQAVGADMYKEARDLLGRAFGRKGERKRIEASLGTTRDHLRIDPNLRVSEAERWVTELQELLATNASAASELPTVQKQLLRLLSSGTKQTGVAGRDQYNIAGDATFVKYKTR
jgi:hypothetical protein